MTVAWTANGLGMRLMAYDPYANPNLATAASVTLRPSLEELLKEAGFLTLHTPLIASTKGMIGRAELERMKPTARILNVARGGMIDEDALNDALNAETIAGAGNDVCTSEPPLPDSSASRLIAHLESSQHHTSARRLARPNRMFRLTSASKSFPSSKAISPAPPSTRPSSSPKSTAR